MVRGESAPALPRPARHWRLHYHPTRPRRHLADRCSARIRDCRCRHRLGNFVVQLCLSKLEPRTSEETGAKDTQAWRQKMIEISAFNRCCECQRPIDEPTRYLDGFPCHYECARAVVAQQSGWPQRI